MDLDGDKNCIVYKIEAENALRFVLNEKSASLKLLDGFAEIFGSELVKNKTYTFLPPASISVFSWQGCSVKFYGQAKSIHLEKQPSMFVCAYMHACLEERRMKAEAENTRGPVSLVIGAKDVGKSSFCRILLNYAARKGRNPLYVDLNVDQNSCSLPGTLSMSLVEKPSNVPNGFNHKSLSVYPFSYISPSHNLPLYFLISKALGKKVRSLFKTANRNTHVSGVIIDTYGFPTIEADEAYSVNKLLASAFDADVVFVINDKQLCLNLKNYLPNRVEVVLVPETGARVRRKGFRSRTRDNCIYDYFYGSEGSLYPYRFHVKFSEIEIYKIYPASKEEHLQDASFNDVNIIKVPFEKELVYHILSLSYCDTVDERILTTNIFGFVCVTDVSLENKCVTLLSPQPYPLPSRILLMGDVQLK